ncbi:4-carboxy-4-hydroxy-2-oxoadipate aldolase/oxaloacetate decarboxylase [Phytohabitans sp. ZYX-F-186]|uniref:Putative 4-hydroxy-4-methyl-2-oxoglutarate aldolase n=1 Tax=Phytohabitans maris TaxID=3071409 RepID=A0ABU0ZQV6_9ACTN|nr:4-carboxy-4-hydroxy-2-oxoadipate aldolase/oxaloacetate decarboxylase [Phytohabitans sp. ZYX-F-186]MDQ7909409.1 4-carboxy-4-hydroxy-2-oxoadipate aldolase/oxaloacetate decarboxylase [Phytohabitans sp. ZYX-F-186]
MSDRYDELARLGVATVYEASGRQGLVDEELVRLVPGSAAAGPARIAVCGPADNRAVHEVAARTQPGDVVVLTMDSPVPVALVGDLLATQLKTRGAAGVLVNGSVRDADALRELGLPVWARWIRVRGATKAHRGAVDVPVVVGGTVIHPGDAVVLDGDGAVVVAADRLDAVLAASRRREATEAEARRRYLAGALSYDLYGYRTADAQPA